LPQKRVAVRCRFWVEKGGVLIEEAAVPPFVDTAASIVIATHAFDAADITRMIAAATQTTQKIR